jgi:F-type H+-transporting ATPase subunit delta
MTDRLTVARPYARAAFEEAQAQRRLDAWSQALAIGAQVVRDRRVAALLDNPRVTPEELAQLVTGISAGELGDTGANFFGTLAVNHRLEFLPEIAALFDNLKDEALGVADVTVTSAAALDEAHRKRLTAALEKRLKRSVRLHCNTDPALIGGAVLRAGDLVIDGSLRTRLERLAYELTA